MRKLLVGLVSAVLALSACVFEDPLVTELRNYIGSQSLPGIYQNSQSLYVFKEDEMQLCWNPTTQMCRLQDDKANSYLTMQMSKVPVQGETLTLTVVAKSVSVKTNPSYEVEVACVDAASHLVRLIDKTTYYGFVLYYE